MRSMYDLDRAKELSNYEFRLTAKSSTIVIRLDDEETVNANDFLRMLENGSPLHGIIAKRLIERTWLLVNQQMLFIYSKCVELIFNGEPKATIDREMVMLAQYIELKLKDLVNYKLKSTILCNVYYKGEKIN